MDTIRLQVTIGGLSANSNTSGETVLGELDVASGVLLIDASVSVAPGMPETRHDGCAVVTNNAGADDHDMLFADADIRDAITEYFSFAGRGLLVLDEAVARHNPGTKIEPDGLDERGRKYRIAPDMTNGQMAVIVMCWAAVRQNGFARQLAAFDDMQDVSITTVGIPGKGEVAGYTMGGKLALGRDGWPL